MIGRQYVVDCFLSHVRQKQRLEIVVNYITTALYGMSNMKSMTQTLQDLEAAIFKPQTESRNGKEEAEAVAEKLGVKINWGGEDL